MIATIERFSTERIAPRGRLAYWNELAQQTFAGITVDSTNQAFRAKMLRWSVGDLTMIRPQSEGALVRRVTDDSSEERVIVHLQTRGRCEQRQRGMETLLQPGDLSVCTTAAPFQLKGSDHEMMVVECPRAPLEARLPDLDDRLSCLIRGTSPAARIFHDFLRSLWREGDRSDDDPSWQAGVSAVFMDLLAMAMRGTPRPDLSSHGHITHRLKALVDARLGDPELRASTLADELGISIRSVQNLFAGMATTPSAYILKRRLERAAERLETDMAQSITAIAFDLGFNDSAYFTRCFRQHFGVPPTVWRIGHRSVSVAH